MALQTGLILLAELGVSAGMIWPETVVIVVGVLFAGTLTRSFWMSVRARVCAWRSAFSARWGSPRR